MRESSPARRARQSRGAGAAMSRAARVLQALLGLVVRVALLAPATPGAGSRERAVPADPARCVCLCVFVCPTPAKYCQIVTRSGIPRLILRNNTLLHSPSPWRNPLRWSTWRRSMAHSASPTRRRVRHSSALQYRVQMIATWMQNLSTLANRTQMLFLSWNLSDGCRNPFTPLPPLSLPPPPPPPPPLPGTAR